MKVFIIGLGLMGASFAEALRDIKHEIYGYDKDESTTLRAINDKIIIDSNLSHLETSDLIIMCLYPKDNIEFITKHKNLFKNQLLIDISGTKIEMVNSINQLIPKMRYVSTHPMAGREKAGYENKDISMFKKANFLVIETNTSTSKDIEMVSSLAKQLGFSRVTIIDPIAHDKLIAHTSQLTHLLAVALMLSDNNDKTKEATGDSYRDLTRIAKINEHMWAQLFLNNKEVLIETTDHFIKKLEDLKELIKNNDSNSLINELKKSKEKRISFDDFKN